MAVRMSRAERREQTRQELLTAAEACFVSRGFHASSVDQVAERAGYTKGAVYSNFAAKEDLFFAVYARRVDQVLTEVVPDLRQAGAERAFDQLATTLRAVFFRPGSAAFGAGAGKPSKAPKSTGPGASGTGAKGVHGRCVSKVATSDATGGPNDNHGGAVSAAAKSCPHPTPAASATN